MNISILQNAGIDYNKGVDRFLGDSQLYELVLNTFLDDTTLTQAEKAIKKKDYQSLFACIHELKGASGNADMTELYNNCCEFVNLIRGKNFSEEEIEVNYNKFAKAYLKAKDGIEKAKEG